MQISGISSVGKPVFPNRSSKDICLNIDRSQLLATSLILRLARVNYLTRADHRYIYSNIYVYGADITLCSVSCFVQFLRQSHCAANMLW